LKIAKVNRSVGNMPLRNNQDGEGVRAISVTPVRLRTRTRCLWAPIRNASAICYN